MNLLHKRNTIVIKRKVAFTTLRGNELKCTSKSDLKRCEVQVGCRYSSLLKLPYFDPPTMLVIDSMHNLFLGIAKHFVKRVFIDKQIIRDSEFDVIQDRVNE